MKLPEKVYFREVGPRDGLQNENNLVKTADKVQLINLLSASGLDYIEVTSFVHPKWIPQLADAADVLKQIERRPLIKYAALVPNMNGLARALEANIDEVSVFMSASEGHNKNNINKTIEETFPVLEEVVKGALAAGKTVRGYISTAFECPYDGIIQPKQVSEVAERLFAMGVQEISLGDTTGVAVPTQVEALLQHIGQQFDLSKIAMHFHDTNGTAIANIMTSLQFGIDKFDSSIGGLGGCPYAKGASGNIATEDLLYVIQKLGIDTTVYFQKIIETAQFIEERLGKTLKSKQLDIARGDQ